MFHHPTDSLAAQQHALRILVVEDNLLIAETIVDLLEECGCEVIGPVPDLGGGLRLLEEGSLDGALLDINLAGTLSFPLAQTLSEQGIPFVFLTGYDEGAIFPPEFRAVRRISKPFDRKEVAEVVEVWGQLAGH